MIDTVAAKRMEETAKMILKMPEENREAAYELLKQIGGMTDEQVQGFREYVFYYRMFTDHRFYKAVEQTVGAMVYESLHK